jgi:hypothetical protein
LLSPTLLDLPHQYWRDDSLYFVHFRAHR